MRLPLGTLTDTGPLFALADAAGQPVQYAHCQAVPPTLTLPLVTTWPCLAEAMHLTGRAGRWPMQEVLGRRLTSGTLCLRTLSEAETTCGLALMAQSQDRPMDLADASLIAAAEADGYARIFSLDSDFYVYRLSDGTAIEVIPGPLPRTTHT